VQLKWNTLGGKNAAIIVGSTGFGILFKYFYSEYIPGSQILNM